MKKEKKDPYEEGRLAAMNGVDFTANPYSHPFGDVESFHKWFAGWCFGCRIK